MFATHIALQMLAAGMSPAPAPVPADAPPSLPNQTPPAPAVTAPATATPGATAPIATDPLADPAAPPPAAPPVATPYSAAEDPLADNGPGKPAETRVPGESDPLQPINRVFYAVSQPIDRFVLRPAAIAYKTAVPRPLRDGARNAIQNLEEPVVIFNDILQLHPGRALKGILRLAINSTLGLGGLFDAAKRKPFHIPHHNNGFGNTLGYYGMPPLIYFYLPVLGPTTLRDTAGDVGDDFSRPRLLYKITHPDSDRPLWKGVAKMGKVGTAMMVVGGLDKRAENDDELETIRKDSVDPYAALRSSFLQDRAGEIAALHARDGAEAKNPHLDDPLTDPAAKK